MSEEIRRIPRPEEGFDRSEPDSKGVFVFTVATVVLLLVVMGAVQVYFNYVWANQVEKKVLEQGSEDLAKLHERENKQLSAIEVTDKGKGTMRIPIDRAMELVAKEAAEGKTWYPGAATPQKPEDLVPGGARGGAYPGGKPPEPAAAAAPAPAPASAEHH
jgi:hypothetical protein